MRSSGSIRFESVPAEPGRFWIRHAPTSWPGPSGWWLDLARAEPASGRLRGDLVGFAPETTLSDVVYLPPLETEGEILRQEILQACSRSGVPAVQQVLPGDTPPAGAGPIVVDLGECLLHRRLAEVVIPPRTWAVWPLIAGLTDSEPLRSEGLEILESAGVVGVLGIAPILTPVQRRELAERAPAASYSEVFHGDIGESVRAFSVAVAARGLLALPPQPPLARQRRAPNRALAAHFSMLAELWLRSGRSEGRAQKFFSVARRVECEPVDVVELARRGGLGGVDWLDAEARGEIVQIAQAGRSALVTKLEEELRRGGEREW